MGKRFGRRAADGTTEYFDSREELNAAADQEGRDSRAALFAFLGLVSGGILTHSLLQKLGAGDWPKAIRFICVIAGAGGGAVLLGMLSDFIWRALMFLLAASILVGVAALIWHVV